MTGFRQGHTSLKSTFLKHYEEAMNRFVSCSASLDGDWTLPRPGSCAFSLFSVFLNVTFTSLASDYQHNRKFAVFMIWPRLSRKVTNTKVYGKTNHLQGCLYFQPFVFLLKIHHPPISLSSLDGALKTAFGVSCCRLASNKVWLSFHLMLWRTWQLYLHGHFCLLMSLPFFITTFFTLCSVFMAQGRGSERHLSTEEEKNRCDQWKNCDYCSLVRSMDTSHTDDLIGTV